MPPLFAFWLAVFAVLLVPVAPGYAAAENEKPEKTEPYKAPTSLSGSFLSGRFAKSKGDRRAAIHYLESALERDPENHAIKGQLLVLALAGGDIPSALERAQELQPVKGHEPLVDLVLAVDAVNRGELEAAHADFKQVFEATGNALWESLFLAWVDYGRGKLKKPLMPTDLIPEEQTAPAFLAYQIALVNDIAGFTEIAAKQYEMALVDHAKAPFRAVEAAADFYRRRGDNKRLEQLKADFMSAHPNASALMDSEIAAQTAALMEQKVGQGNKRSRLVGTVQDGVAEVLFTMASVLYSVDAQQDTLLYLRMALLLRPDYPLAQLLLGGVLEEDGRYADAADIYAGVDEDGPLAERALLRRAYMIERQGRLEEALTMLDARAEANPENYDAYVAKGDLLRMRQKYREAADAYTQALAKIPHPEPRHWGIFFARGACYERVGEWPVAEADLRKALVLNPDHPEVLNYLGYGMLARDENLEEAGELIEQAFALQPNAPHIMDSMGWMLLKRGDVSGAMAQLEQAIELMPGDATVNDHLGDVYWYAGRKTEARYQWERTLTFSPEPEVERVIRLKLKEGLPPLALKEKPQSMRHAADAELPEILN